MRLCDLAGKSAQEADELLNQSNPNVFAAASGKYHLFAALPINLLMHAFACDVDTQLLH